MGQDESTVSNSTSQPSQPSSARAELTSDEPVLAELGTKWYKKTDWVAQWTDSEKCKCNQIYYKILKTTRKSVPMAGEWWGELGKTCLKNKRVVTSMLALE